MTKLKSLKFLACGDLHLNFDLLESALTHAQEEKVDFVILTGDIANGEKLSEAAESMDFLQQIEPIYDILNRFPLFVYFVPGNHDPCELTELLPIRSRNKKIKSLHGTKVYHDYFCLGGIGGSHYVVPQLIGKTVPFPEGCFPELVDIPRLEHLYTLSQKVPRYIYSGVHSMYRNTVFPCDILITHTPPFRPQKDNHRVASLGLMALISEFKPLINIAGHIHNPKENIETIQWNNEQSIKTTTLIRTGELADRIVFLLTLNREKEISCTVDKIKI